MTEAFRTAATIRAKMLGMPAQPTVVIDHPMANKTPAEITAMAQRFVDAIAAALMETP